MRSLHFYFRRSRLLYIYLWSLHLFILVAVWCLPTQFWLALTFSVLIFMSLCLKLLCWRASSLSLFINRDNDLRIQYDNGESLDVEVSGSCRMGRYYVLIPLRSSVNGKNFRKRLLIMKDSLPEVDYRLLRMRILLRSEQPKR